MRIIRSQIANRSRTGLIISSSPLFRCAQQTYSAVKCIGLVRSFSDTQFKSQQQPHEDVDDMYSDPPVPSLPRRIYHSYIPHGTILMRAQMSNKVLLRTLEYARKAQKPSFDIAIHEDGLAHPSKTRPHQFLRYGGNGCRCQTLGPKFQDEVFAYARDPVIYLLNPGTPVPVQTVLAQTSPTDFWLEPSVSMGLKDFESIITSFLATEGIKLSRKEFSTHYPYFQDMTLEQQDTYLDAYDKVYPSRQVMDDANVVKEDWRVAVSA